ncbi:TraR/DksA C4-type zinc finger protein [Streptomyces sp. RS10V-4]|uniref:TraR/DksA family transcriptional regulator n=1 Tax=Streptomyces rhizoryzae TaxID=2932493 RepID=UPI0020054B8B|nr:TraR/DksA C4-type zinc finger protein [Streptomyces rhizoryzae]MCK7622107.1 TraR/DksA C4-type zinc finger protein [Streptomyces rhizoryzae]
MVAKKTAAEKTTTSAGPADEDVVKQSGHEEAAAPKKAAKKAPAKKAVAGKAAVKKAAAKKTAGSGKRAAGQEAAGETGAGTMVAKKTAAAPASAPGADSAAPPARALADPGELAVRPGEDPWTSAEVDEARGALKGEVVRLRAEITAAEDAIAGLMRDSGDGAGDDEADTGTKNITREHELALASNAREMLHQTERALGRLDAGTYGVCENCGKPIGKARMQAFPRATLCVECKQKQERR